MNGLSYKRDETAECEHRPMAGLKRAAYDVDELYRLTVMLRAERILYEAANFPSDKENLAAYDEGVGRISHKLTHETPVCRTAEGAAEALRLVADEIGESAGSFSASVLASVLDFVRRREEASEFVDLVLDEAMATEAPSSS